MIRKKFTQLFKDRIWVFGILIGLIIGLTYISIKQLEANDSVVHYNVTIPLDEEEKAELREFIEADENEGKDIILVPDEPIDVLSSEERRLRDEERAEQEAQELQATVEAGIDEGIFVDSPEELACKTEAEAIENTPSLYLLCGNDIVPAPSNTTFVRVETSNEAQDLLTTYVLELLGNITPTNQNIGYESFFSDSRVLNELTLSDSGNVNLDFNDKFVEQHGQLHGSTAARMLEQLNRTIFQFREVNTISVTLNGSCEAFAQLFEFSCVNLDRETWQQMLELNDDQVEYFDLIGGQ